MQEKTRISNLLVRKYGGSSLSSITKIQSIAKDIANTYKENPSILIIVSAMGKTTDDLYKMAKQIAPLPNSREMDMLLSTGERVTAALLSMALDKEGISAVSFTGSQAGILTCGLHNNARIKEVNPYRIENELKNNKVVILAGFQGVNPDTKDITTLGRGGSDTTAVALAHHLRAEKVELKKDVEGVFSWDPNKKKGAKHFDHLSFSQLVEMTSYGAKIIHHRAVELAKNLSMPIEISLAHGEGKKTRIDNQEVDMEEQSFIGLQSNESILQISIKKEMTLLDLLKKYNLHTPKILAVEDVGEFHSYYLALSKETISLYEEVALKESLSFDKEKVSITLNSKGNLETDLIFQANKQLKDIGIDYLRLWQSPLSLTYLLNASDFNKAFDNLSQLIK